MTRTIGEALYEGAQERLREVINAEAAPLGWFIAESSGSECSEFQLQNDDEAGMFRDDDAVWDHVWERSLLEPSGIEARALDWLKRNCPNEYRYIKAACGRVFPLSRTPPPKKEEPDDRHWRRTEG